MPEQDNEFYIGWQAEAPPQIARLVRRFVFALAVFVPAVALLVVGFQRGFSNGTFEYGKLTELEGILTTHPVPFLTIQNGGGATGKPVLQKILLVGPGKFGFAEGKNGQWATLANTTAPQPVHVSGFLIYHDGKTALEVAEIETLKPSNPQTFKPSNPQTLKPSNLQTLKPSNPQTFKPSNLITLQGELADPKCLLGVMKPGEGKPHRDCAARCIAGGIPPLMKVANAGGDTEYYLLVGPNGEALNDQLLPYAADGVRVCGRLEQVDDWLVLYTDPATLQRVNKYALNPGPLCQ